MYLYPKSGDQKADLHQRMGVLFFADIAVGFSKRGFRKD
jgi:hypothetical protein